MSRGKASHSGLLSRQPQSSTSESDATTCDCDAVCPVGDRHVIHARPTHAGFGGRITSWIWGRGLEPINGRSKDSLFYLRNGRPACISQPCNRIGDRPFLTWRVQFLRFLPSCSCLRPPSLRQESLLPPACFPGRKNSGGKNRSVPWRGAASEGRSATRAGVRRAN